MCVVVCAEDCKRNHRIATYKTGACSLEGAKYIHDHKHFFLISPQRSNASPWLCVCVCLSLCGCVCVRVAPLSTYMCVYVLYNMYIYLCVPDMCVPHRHAHARRAAHSTHSVHTRRTARPFGSRSTAPGLVSTKSSSRRRIYACIFTWRLACCVWASSRGLRAPQGYRNPNKPHLRPSPNERTCMGWHERHASLRWGSRGIYVPRR